MIRHAGLVALRLGGRWRGALIEGPSGAGKSDLALRALGLGFRLVADDRVLVWTSGGRLFGRAPEPLSGLIEARGLPLQRVEPLPLAEVVLLVRLGAPERLPDPMTTDMLGLAIPTIALAPFEDSAAVKLGRALDDFDAAANRRI